MQQHKITSPNSLIEVQNKDNNSVKQDAVFEKKHLNISPEEIKKEAEKYSIGFNTIPHTKLLALLLAQIEKLNFRNEVGLRKEKEYLSKKHYLVVVIEKILSLAKKNRWGICQNNNFIYLFNGEYWNLLSEDTFQNFLGEAAEKMGTDKYDARLYSFREQLYKQFLSAAHLPKPERKKDVVLINLKNGTFEIRHDKQFLRKAASRDFLTYQLPFEYHPTAKCPMFQNFLNEVLPDTECQTVLAEYLGYVFINSSTLKLEKTLLLYGSGANGKSVIFEIVNALFGKENVSNYSLKSLTKYDGYERAELANVLINYGSEINGNLEASIFKQLVSGEPVEARQIYGEPFILTDYAKLIFNCNELPRDVELTNAFFRRFIILPFDVVIEEDKQDKELANKIIASELSGIFNWVLVGLKRLLIQKSFSNCNAAFEQLKQYREQSDTVLMFLKEEEFKKTNDFTALEDLYNQYRQYCNNYGHHHCSKKTFSMRLKNAEYEVERKSQGMVVYVKKCYVASAFAT